MRKFAAFICLILLTCIASGCVVETPEEPVFEDRLPIAFIAASDVASARQTPETMALNYINCLVKGDYETALQYANIPDGVLFDANALQAAALQDGFGRGDSVTFYSVMKGEKVSDDNGNEAVVSADSLVSVEYDLTLSGITNTVSKKIKISQTEAGYGVDMSSHIIEGTLKFRVPKYVDAYINGAEIPKSYLDANYTYTISAGVPKLDEDNLTLTLKTNFGVEQSYPLVFLGNATKSKNAVNDDYYYSRDDISLFYIDAPRELRESAMQYVSTEVFSKLCNDELRGTSWDVAEIQSEFRADSNIDGMFSYYYKTASSFTTYTTKDGGLYVFYNVNCHNFECTDALAEKKSSRNCITDYNVLQLYVQFDYNFLYTRGTGATERNSQGTIGTVVYLSLDESGNWYIYDLDEQAFKLKVA